MKILILGATGMLGHKLMQVLSREHTVTGTVRRNASVLANYPIFSKMDIIGNISADNLETVRTAIDKANPEVIINCVGIVKQSPRRTGPLAEHCYQRPLPSPACTNLQAKKHPAHSHEHRLCILGTERVLYRRRSV